MRQINGQKIAEKIIKKLKLQPAPKKILAAILIGENPASLSFLKQKEKVAKELGVDFRIYKFPEDVAADFLKEEIGKIASSGKTGGVIIQLPLPPPLDRNSLLKAIPIEKDVDVLNGQTDLILPPAVGVAEEILKTKNLQLKNLKIAVVGLGFLVGQPIAAWLKGKCSEIFLVDIDDDLSILKQVDLVISGVGQAGLIKPEMLKPGAGVIDFGYSLKNGKISGDFNAKLPITNYQLLNFYTPTPGGTGPILVAKLFENFYTLAGV